MKRSGWIRVGLGALLLMALLAAPAGAITPKPTEGVTISTVYVGALSFTVSAKITTSRLVVSKGFDVKPSTDPTWDPEDRVVYTGKENPFTLAYGGYSGMTYNVRAYCAFSKTDILYSKTLSLSIKYFPNITVAITEVGSNTVDFEYRIQTSGNIITEASFKFFYPDSDTEGPVTTVVGENIGSDTVFDRYIIKLLPNTEYSIQPFYRIKDSTCEYQGDRIYFTTRKTPTPTPKPTATPIPTAEPTATPKPTATQAPTATPKPTSVATPVPTTPGDPTATPQPTETNPPDPTDTQAPEPTTTEPTTTEPTTTGPTDPADTPTEGGSGQITDTVTQPESQGGLFGNMSGGVLALVVGLAAALLLVIGILVGKLGRKA